MDDLCHQITANKKIIDDGDVTFRLQAAEIMMNTTGSIVEEMEVKYEHHFNTMQRKKMNKISD